jgi:hypothetical protein
MPLEFGFRSCFAAAVDDSPISSPLVTAMVVEILKLIVASRRGLKKQLYAVESRAGSFHARQDDFWAEISNRYLGSAYRESHVLRYFDVMLEY